MHLTEDGSLRTTLIDPAALGIDPPGLAELAGSDTAAAAQCCEKILAGKGTAAQSDIVALNAAWVVAGAGIAADLESGFRASQEILRNGAALDKLRFARSSLESCVTRVK